MATKKTDVEGGFTAAADKHPQIAKAQREFIASIADRVEKGEPFARAAERKLIAGILRHGQSKSLTNCQYARRSGQGRSGVRRIHLPASSARPQQRGSDGRIGADLRRSPGRGRSHRSSKLRRCPGPKKASAPGK